MQNKSLELQKIIINSVNNIDYLKQQNIKIYSSIPDKIKTPYIKLSCLSMNTKQNVSNVQSFTIELFIATNWKNNKSLLEIMENLYKHIAIEINKYANYNNEIESNIYNIYNLNYKIKENLENNIWNGYFYLDIDLN